MPPHHAARAKAPRRAAQAAKRAAGSHPRILMAMMATEAPQEDAIAPPPPAEEKPGPKEATALAEQAVRAEEMLGEDLESSWQQLWPRKRRAATVMAAEPLCRAAAAAAKWRQAQSEDVLVME